MSHILSGVFCTRGQICLLRSASTPFTHRHPPATPWLEANGRHDFPRVFSLTSNSTQISLSLPAGLAVTQALRVIICTSLPRSRRPLLFPMTKILPLPFQVLFEPTLSPGNPQTCQYPPPFHLSSLFRCDGSLPIEMIREGALSSLLTPVGTWQRTGSTAGAHSM